MTDNRTSSDSTRERLLDAACRTFAEKGFRDATVAMICREAGANIAAVNYHFHSKEELYVEAWRRAFHASIAAHPPEGGVAADAPPADRLRGRIVSLMSRILDPETCEFDIVHKELANPTGLLAEVFAECVQPMQQAFQGVVRELLGPAADQRDVALCQRSIIAQCLHLLMPSRQARRQPVGPERIVPPATADDIDALADHVVRFSLAGIAEVRRQAEAGSAPVPRSPKQKQKGPAAQHADT